MIEKLTDKKSIVPGAIYLQSRRTDFTQMIVNVGSVISVVAPFIGTTSRIKSFRNGPGLIAGLLRVIPFVSYLNTAVTVPPNCIGLSTTGFH